MDPDQLKAMAPQLAGMDPSQIKMMSKMMSGMKPEDMKNMAKMAQQMGGGMPGMGGGMGPPAAGGGSSSAQPGAASSSAVTAGAAANPMAGMAGMGGMDMANMDMGKGLDMMGSMSPDMMQAGMNMMKHARWLDTAPGRCAHRAAPHGPAWPRLARLPPPWPAALPVARGWPMPRGQARTAARTAGRAARAPRGAQGAGRGVSWGAGGGTSRALDTQGPASHDPQEGGARGDVSIYIHIYRRNMDPKAMASMSKMMGREVSEGEMEKMQSMMRRSQQLKAPSWRRHSAPHRPPRAVSVGPGLLPTPRGRRQATQPALRGCGTAARPRQSRRFRGFAL